MAEERLGMKIIFLLLLLILVISAVVYWFNYLGLISLPRAYYRFVDKVPLLAFNKDVRDPFLLEKEYYEKLQESYEARFSDLKKMDKEIQDKQEKLNELTQVLEDQQNSLKEKEQITNQKLKQYEDYRENIKNQAKQFINMPPADSVKILNEMDILIVIDILRAIDAYATEQNQASIVPYLLSLMPGDRAARINEYMVEGANVNQIP